MLTFSGGRCGSACCRAGEVLWPSAGNRLGGVGMESARPPKRVRFMRFAFWCAFVFTLVMALLPHPPSLPGQASDKVQHMAAFAALTFLAAVSFSGLRYWLIFAVMAALGAAIEVLQMIPSLQRDAEVLDWVADCASSLGVLLCCAIVLRLFSRASR